MKHIGSITKRSNVRRVAVDCVAPVQHQDQRRCDEEDNVDVGHLQKGCKTSRNENDETMTIFGLWWNLFKVFLARCRAFQL